MDVSVIIPVFNSGVYLERCLRSVISQENIELEVLCVDDASEDESADIILKCAEEDARITLIRLTENHGQAYARNIGIRSSRGKYIYFLDSDDELFGKKSLEELKREAEMNESDCVCFDSDIIYEEEDLKPLLACRTILNENIEKGVYDGKEYFVKFFSNPEYYVAVWRQFWRKDYLIENNLFFHEDTSPHEDLLFTFQAFFLASKIYYLNESFHRYHFRKNSSSSGKMNLKRIQAYQRIYVESFSFLEKYKEQFNEVSEKSLSQYFRACLTPIYLNYGMIIQKEGFDTQFLDYSQQSDNSFALKWIIIQKFPLLERVFTAEEIQTIKGAAPLIIYGAGNYSVHIQQMLLDFGIRDYMLCTTDGIKGTDRISDERLDRKNSVIILGATSLYRTEMKKTARELGFERIIDLGE